MAAPRPGGAQAVEAEAVVVGEGDQGGIKGDINHLNADDFPVLDHRHSEDQRDHQKAAGHRRP
ncbi:MAG: hypothetical protein F8N37_14005 [Telmatospirillum sp.]|nr:hypothetical protein [Telmatospirillum sp.]